MNNWRIKINGVVTHYVADSESPYEGPASAVWQVIADVEGATVDVESVGDDRLRRRFLPDSKFTEPQKESALTVLLGFGLLG